MDKQEKTSSAKDEFEEQNGKRKLETTEEQQRDEKGNPYFWLSKKRRATVLKFDSGDHAVDIREFYQDKKTGELKPGKGICLPMDQWNKLKDFIGDIDAAANNSSSSSSSKEGAASKKTKTE